MAEKILQEKNTDKQIVKQYDCFISHASEDKTDFVGALVEKLESKGVNVWYDANIMNIGDSLRESIDNGLKNSLCGVVVLSKNFFEKHWTDYELNGLVARQNSNGKKIILPVWHNITIEEVREYSLSLSDIVAGNSKSGVETVARSIIKAINNIKEDKNEPDFNSLKIGKSSNAMIEKFEIENSENIKSEDAKKIIEEFILDDKNIITVHKFINQQCNSLINTLKDDFSALASLQTENSVFYERVLAYDEYCEQLLTILVTGSYWGSDKYNTLWINLFKRFSNLKVMETGYTSLIKLQKYPSLLIYYALLIVGLLKEDYFLLYKVFHGFDVNEYNDEGTEPVNIFYPENIVSKNSFNSVLNQNYKTPINDHLHDVLRQFFTDILPEDNEFSLIFDRVEYLISIEFALNRLNMDFGFWAPPGRYSWRYQFSKSSPEFTSKNHPFNYFKKLSKKKNILEAELLGGTLEKYNEVTEKHNELLTKFHFW